MEKLIILTLILIAAPVFGFMQMVGQHVDVSATVVEWACDSTGLDKYDATDGGTTSLTGTNFLSDGNVGKGIDIQAAAYCYMTATDGNNIDYTQGTIELWVKETVPVEPFARLFQFGTDTGSFCARRHNYDLTINFEIEDVNALFTTTTNIFDGTGHLVRITWDTVANERKLYIDGVQEGGTNTTTISETTPTGSNFYIGCADTDERQINGIVDSFKIWHTVEAP